jgi:hypothetical protein
LCLGLWCLDLFNCFFYHFCYIVVAQNKQHIQVQAGKDYQLSAKDFNTKKASLIAKKVSNDLEISLENNVVVFDDYFEICATDLSCLVSLPTKNGGLYHVLADTVFTLEDGTQIVYFYGEQSIVSTESSTLHRHRHRHYYQYHHHRYYH